jgi:stage V sporulation protein R
MTDAANGPLYETADWDFATLQRIHDACEKIALGELGLDVYPNRIEIITAEQMLDAYSSVGMPLYYRHWSFGKHFASQEAFYRKGLMGLAYEIVINSSPCISYLMEENTSTTQALVIAHAAFGHNHFFKNNYLFKQWTDADGILDYLDFAKKYVAQCEERYGSAAVERTLDAAHALMSHGVHRYPGKKKTDLRDEERRARERRIYEEGAFNDLWRTTVPSGPRRNPAEMGVERRKALLGLPQENLLYFLEKSAPRLNPWQREILRIVQHIAQYFYPQGQTKVMNEGTATYVHYRIMSSLHDQGKISDGHFLEFLSSHTNVIFQPNFDDPRFSGFNPYALGFAMMRDIERIVIAPDDEDREWFPDIAGTGDAMAVLRHVWANYRDESFIRQFLSPRLMRHFRMFHLHDDPEERAGVKVDAIHDDRGYRRIRRELAKQYDVGFIDANIEVVDVDLAGDRRLMLRHAVVKEAQLNEADAKRALQHLADLWSYDVVLREVDSSDAVVKEHQASISHRPPAAGRMPSKSAQLPSQLATGYELCGSTVWPLELLRE